MLVKKKAIVLALLTTCCGGANAIVTSTLNQKLVEQAQYWLQRGRDDNAADAWRKLLKLEPNNTDAIANLAIFEAESGHAELAKSYFSKLKQLQPDHPQIADVESAIRKGTSGKARIAEARQLAMQGKPDEAIERYQMAGSPDKLKGDAALEYFQVLSGTLLGYDDAKAGLERLVKENPGNNRYAYALAQVYTYRAPSRSEGIRMLADLSKKPEVAKQAEDSWRQALSWLGGKKEDEKFLIAYLDRHPDDKVIKDRLAEIRKENKAVPLVNKVAVSQHNASEKKEETEERTQPVSKPQLALNPAKPVSHVDERSVNTIDTSTKNGKTAKTSTPEIIEETPAASTSASKLNNSTNEQAVVANADDQPSDGYTALKRGNLAEAETEFNYVLESAPDDAAALGGLGLVRMRQENFKAARELLGKAIEASPKTSKKLWKEAYDSAAYWALMQDARAEREKGNNDQAIALMRKAIEINDLEPTGRLMLGDALMAADDPIGAEANYRGVLSDHKDNEQALFSLINLLRQQSRAKEADALIAKLTPEQKTLLNGGEDSKVADLREKAKQAEDAGDVVGAQTALEDAMLAAPNNVWIRLELARLYQRRNMPAQARSLLSGLLSAEPPLPDALYVSAMLSAEQQLWWEGMQTLEKIPEKARTKDMAALQKTMWIHVQMDRANVFAQQGNQRQANDILRQVEAVAGNSPEYVSVLAAGYIKNGDVGKGLSILRQALAKTAKPSLGLRLQYADALLRTRQDAELEPLIRQMYATPNLQQQEINALFNLRVALGIRQAEAAREEGNLAAAYNYIAPMLAESPDDNRLILSLARMYSSAGDTMQAAELFTKVLRKDPENQEAYQASVYAGIQIKDFDGAEANLNELLKRQPNNPRYVALAGRLARAKGNNSKALELFQQAMDLERTQPVTGMGINGLRLVDQQGPALLNKVSTNPFAGRTGNSTSSAGSVSYPANRAEGLNLREVAPSSVPRPLPKIAPVNLAPSYKSPVMQPQPVASMSPVSRAYGGYASDAAVIPGLLPQRKTDAVAPAVYREPAAAPTSGRLPSLKQEGPKNTASGNNSQLSEEVSSLQKEIDAIRELNKSSASFGVSIRARSGEKGLSQLKDIETPIEVQLHNLGNGKLGLKIIPVLIDAGTLYLNDPAVAGQFGINTQLNERAKYDKVPFTTVAKNAGLSNVAEIEQQAKGVALSLSYEIASFKVDIGASPVGFAVNNVVGGIRWSEQSDGLSFGAEITRRSVTDSYLSYAGAHDSIYGLTWGGVTKTGVHLDTSYDGEYGGVYASGGYYALTGKNVAKNRMFELGGGAYWRAYKTNDMTVTTGLNMTSMFYNKNLRYFTYGHGGYFSPKSYVALGIPLEVAGRKGSLSYLVGTSIGVQHFTESKTPYFPNNSVDQADLELFAAANPNVGIQTYYPGQTHTGVQFKLTGGLEYQFNPHLFVGSRFSIDNSGDFTDGAGALYLRYSFEPQRQAVQFPPVAPKPYYLGN